MAAFLFLHSASIRALSISLAILSSHPDNKQFRLPEHVGEDVWEDGEDYDDQDNESEDAGENSADILK